MRIEFHPIPIDDEPSYGVFHVSAADCVVFLRDMSPDYATYSDGELLRWIERLREREMTSPSIRIPDEFDRWARYMVVSLWESGFPLAAYCTKCRQTFQAKEFSKHDWEDTGVAGGIKAGVEGVNILCPNGHILLMYLTRIY